MYICRKCKREFEENEEDLVHSNNRVGYLLLLCPCGGVVDLWVGKPKRTADSDGHSEPYYHPVHLDGK